MRVPQRRIENGIMNKDQQHVDPDNYRASDALIFFVVGIAI